MSKTNIKPRPQVRYNGTHVGVVGPRSVQEDDTDSLDSLDQFGAILVADEVQHIDFADTQPLDSSSLDQ